MTEPIDWMRIASELQHHIAELIHGDGPSLHGDEFYAEALKRVFAYQPPKGDGSQGDRDRLGRGHGLTTQADADWTLSGHTVLDRLAREAAEEKVREMRAELARAYREAGQDFADLLRGRCNERSVPSKYRREGVAWAADMIDPRVPKDQYGQLVAETEVAS